jgi:hypothetical protein
VIAPVCRTDSPFRKNYIALLYPIFVLHIDLSVNLKGPLCILVALASGAPRVPFRSSLPYAWATHAPYVTRSLTFSPFYLAR